MAIDSAVSVYQRYPVARPPSTSTYAPSYAQGFHSIYGPAAVVTLSEAARKYVEEQRANRT